ncbi:HAD family hydrolase [Specibacter sp. AOP5-B1-6]|uniref:HAD family hydrolase n=1 Tax=Specibacter sp. AOP5-B1-6 TaxID=3457653 RepID=UPI003FBA6D80
MSKTTLARLAAEQPLPLLILDFDGTVCLGDGPVLAYADAAADQISEPGRTALRDGLAEFLAEDPNAPAYKDGYAAVAALAEGLVDADGLSRAYAQSRQRLAAGTVEISAPDGLAGFLDSLAGVVFRVLLTNAPLVGVPESLAALGLAGSIDLVIPEAGKPSGFAELLPILLADKAPHELLSVGDVWSNDIELPARHGCATAFIDRFEHRSGAATLSSPRFELLYDAISDWARNPAGLLSTQSSTSTPPSEKAPL